MTVKTPDEIMNEWLQEVAARPAPRKIYNLGDLSREFGIRNLSALYRRKSEPLHMPGVTIASSVDKNHSAHLSFKKHNNGFSLTIDFGEKWKSSHHASIYFNETAEGFEQGNTSLCLDKDHNPIFPPVTSKNPIDAVAQKVKTLHSVPAR